MVKRNKDSSSKKKKPTTLEGSVKKKSMKKTKGSSSRNLKSTESLVVDVVPLASMAPESSPIPSPAPSPVVDIDGDDCDQAADAFMKDYDADFLSASKDQQPSSKDPTPFPSPRQPRKRAAGKRHLKDESSAFGDHNSISEHTPAASTDNVLQSVSSEPSPASQISSGNAYSSMFFSSLAKENWDNMKLRKFTSERLLSRSQVEISGVFQLLTSQGLLGTVLCAKPYDRSVVLEFFANLSSRFSLVGSRCFGKVFVRGQIFEVTPCMINEYFKCPNISTVTPHVSKDTVASALTAGQLRQWPHSSQFSTAKLT